jgi:AraC-like DNA-binding protein
MTPKITRFPDNTFAAYMSSTRVRAVEHMDHHYHEGYELLYFMEGESHIEIEGRVHIAKAGDLAVYRPRMVHQEDVQPGLYRIICLRFPRERMELPFPEEHELPPVVHLPWKERFHNVLEQLVLEKKGVDRWSDLMTGTYLMQFVILLWRALSYYSKPCEEDSEEQKIRISHIIDLIHTKIDIDVPLRDLASRACMSESHFSHTFKEVIGVSPKRYMISAKIEKARELLKMTNKTVTQISRHLGYESPHYFNRLFRKECSCTPLEYRKNSRKV